MMKTVQEVYHGNCFDRLAQLPDKSVDLILTDPPYGHNNNDGDLISQWEKACPREKQKRKDKGHKDTHEPRPIHNDSYEEANALVLQLFKEASRLLAKEASCCCCCCGGGGPDPQFARWSLWVDKYLSFDQMVVWDKGRGGLGWKYRRCYEVVIVSHRKGGKLSWYDESGSIWNVIRPGDYGIKKIVPSAAQHPTQKPVKLFAHFIRLHTKPGDLVVDPFCGSGASGVAAKLLGRNWIGCDTDKRWVDLARRRLEATPDPQ